MHGTFNDYQRRLELEGAPNVRDLGGYPTRNGGRTRWGRLLRAGRLSTLTERDLSVLSRYRLRAVCDFRHAAEAARDPSRLETLEGVAVHNLPIVPGSHSSGDGHFEWTRLTPEEMAGFMVRINRELALEQTAAYRRMFELLLAIEDGAFLFHCSAGKDRTGFAAAIILSALGVSRETIMEDYLLTARYYPPPGEAAYLAGKYLGRSPSEDDETLFMALMDAREQYLSAAFEAIDERYGSVSDYLEDALGLDEQKRAILVERYVE